MMNKKIKIIFKSLVAVLFASGICMGQYGCTNGKEKSSLDITKVKVWSESSNVKYVKDDISKANNENCQLKYDVVRNEYESKQLLITPSIDIKEYYLETEELVGAKNVIGKENISVYMEKYVFLNSGHDKTVYGSGWYPDALVPIEAAKTAGELNAKANENSALWITIYIPKDIESGVYTANFKLKMDGITKIVPVEVMVQDYTLTDEVNAYTSFTWRYNRVGSGEMDYTTDMFNYYYDYFLDYRISLENPVVDFVTGEEYVKALIEHWDRITNYTFNPYWGELGAAESLWNITSSQLKAVAAASTPERNLLKKAMFYFIDEPNLENEEKVTYCINTLKRFNQNILELVDEIDKDKTDTYSNLKRIDNWKECITNIPNVVTVDLNHLEGRFEETKIQELLSNCNCLCPVWRNASLTDFEWMKEKLENEYNIQVWWYGCIQPNAPYANYHIGDTNLLNIRSISWLQKKYNIYGNLYWDAAAYTSYADSTYGQPVDVYSSPYRAVGIPNDLAGDGFLTYPGAKYGIYGPIPSMRLMQIRDGNEDYELLLDLENKYKNVAESKGISTEQMMERLYDGLYYNGSMLLADGNKGLNFNDLRSEIVNLLLSEDDDCKFYILSVEVKNNRAKVEFTFDDTKYSVMMGTKELQPTGDKYFIDLPLSNDGSFNFKLTNLKTGQKIIKKRYIGTAVNQAIQFENYKEIPNEVIVSDDSNAYVNQENKFKTSISNFGFNISSKITGDLLTDQIYEPFIEMKAGLFNVKFDEIVYMHFDIYNLNPETDTISISIGSGYSIYTLSEVALKPGKNSIDVSFKGFVFSNMNSIDKVVFSFQNKGEVDNPYVHKITLDNVYAVLEG